MPRPPLPMYDPSPEYDPDPAVRYSWIGLLDLLDEKRERGETVPADLRELSDGRVVDVGWNPNDGDPIVVARRRTVGPVRTTYEDAITGAKWTLSKLAHLSLDLVEHITWTQTRSTP